MAALTPTAMLKLVALAGGTLALVPVQLVAMAMGPRAAHVIPIVFHRLLCGLIGVRQTVRGLPPARGACGLIVANHISWLDISVIGSRAPVSFIAKSEIAGWPVFGYLSRLQRTLFIDRSRRGATADVSAVMGERLAAGESLVLFAEGTTGDGTRVLPLKSSLIGAVHQALGEDNAEITVWPLSIAYVGRRGIPAGRFGRAHLAWYGDTELGPHLVDILNGGPLDVTLTWGEPILMGHAVSRKEAARLAEKSLKQALALAVTGRGHD
jgi:lyso-ornithine lipid O-acyltransferase